MKYIAGIFLIILFGIGWFLIQEETKETTIILPISTPPKVITTPISQNITTPHPDQKHYIPYNKNIITQYPQWYNAQLLSSGSLNDWITILPQQQKETQQYLVIRRLGMIVPVSTNTLSAQDFFTSSVVDQQLQQGAVQHPIVHQQPLIIAGHTSSFVKHSSPFVTIFQALVLLQSGDIIELYQKNSSGQWLSTDYTVTSSKIVSAKDTKSLSEHDSSELILYGCYPFGSTKQRIVVYSKKEIYSK